MTNTFEDQVLALVDRMRPGYRAFAAIVDLLGVRRAILNDSHEARSRINDLQRAFGEGVLLFPGGEDYRVCFLGDSLLVTLELKPEDDLQRHWLTFCGHIYALSALAHELEREIGNPGVRVIISYGALFQIAQPDAWRSEHISDFTKHWFVLTGASEALAKCDLAERGGAEKGFHAGYCWHEIPADGCHYRGTRLVPIAAAEARRPELYGSFYQRMCRDAERQAILEFEAWE